MPGPGWIAALLSAFDAMSIVAWFVLLIVVFAIVVGFGIYAGRRDERDESTEGTARPATPPTRRETQPPRSATRAPADTRKAARPVRHHKEYT